MPIKTVYQGIPRLDLVCCACGMDSEGFGALMDAVAMNVGEHDLRSVPDVWKVMKRHKEACPGHEPELVIGVA